MVGANRIGGRQISTSAACAATAAEPATAPAPPEETDEEDDKDVPTNQVDKYISVYESMQKDHGLTVEQATSKQGLRLPSSGKSKGKSSATTPCASASAKR